MKYAQKVQRLREIRGWTQKELGSLVEVSQAAIARLESGSIGDPKARGVLKMAKILGVPVEVLLDDDVSIEKWKAEVSSIHMDREGRELVKLHRGLRPQQKKLLVNFSQLLKQE